MLILLVLLQEIKDEIVRGIRTTIIALVMITCIVCRVTSNLSPPVPIGLSLNCDLFLLLLLLLLLFCFGDMTDEEETKDDNLNCMDDLNDQNNRSNEESHKNGVKIYGRCASRLRYQVQKDCKRNDYHQFLLLIKVTAGKENKKSKDKHKSKESS